MKKKHRDIVVDGVTYGWISGFGQVSIFLNKKRIGGIQTEGHMDITPKLIADAIRTIIKAKSNG